MNKKVGLGMRLRALYSGLGLILLAFAAEALAATEVRSVRLWRAPDNTRLVFDLSGPVQHSVFTLSAPERIVIDVSGAQLATQLQNLAFANTPITSMRSAQRGDQLRLVIDLSKGVTPKSFTLAPNQQYGHRLVVDLFDQGGEAPPATAPVANTPITQAPIASAPTAITSPAPLPPSAKRDVVIAIDAGHGGDAGHASG